MIVCVIRGFSGGEEVGQWLESACGVDVYEDGFGLGDDSVVGGPGEFVEVFESDAVGVAFAGGEEELVVVAGGCFVADLEFDDDEGEALVFEGFVVVAVESEQFGASHFEVDGVAAVVDGVLAVDLAVTYADGDLAGEDGGVGRCILHGWAPGHFL